MGSTLRWTVGGERMDYLSEVRSETLSGCSTGHGALGKLVEENQLLRGHVAERNAIIESQRVEAEKQGIECSRRGSEIDYLNMVLRGSRAKQDELQAENEQLKANRFSGYVCTPSADFDTGPGVAMAPLTVLPLTVGNALIQPTSIRIELPGGVVITIPQPKD